jgi:hypothetical protein
MMCFQRKFFCASHRIEKSFRMRVAPCPFVERWNPIKVNQ